jgi:hypothetical protein
MEMDRRAEINILQDITREEGFAGILNVENEKLQEL